MRPRRPQEASKTRIPNGFPSLLVGLRRQEASKLAFPSFLVRLEAAKTAQDGPRRLQDGPRWPKLASKLESKSKEKSSKVFCSTCRSSKVI